MRDFSENASACGNHVVGSAPSNKAKTTRVTLRLTEQEIERLRFLSAGMSVSAYIRDCLFGPDASPRKVRSRVPVQNEEALARVLGRLGKSRIANNLNQIAFHANTGSLLMDQKMEDQINEAYSHICLMRSDLMTALGLSSGV